MKYISLALLLFIAILGRLRAESNLANNGSFEDWSSARTTAADTLVPELLNNLIPTGFHAGMEGAGVDQPSNVRIAQDPQVKHGGEFSIRIESSDSQLTSFIFLGPIPIEPLSRYLVRVWIKGEDIVSNSKPGGAMLWVHTGPEGNFWQGKRSPKFPELREGTFDWTLFEFSFDSDPDANLLRLVLQLRNATGKVWFDDLEILPDGKVESGERF